MNKQINKHRVNVFRFSYCETQYEITHKINTWIESLEVQINIINITSNKAYNNSTLLFLMRRTWWLVAGGLWITRHPHSRYTVTAPSSVRLTSACWWPVCGAARYTVRTCPPNWRDTNFCIARLTAC